MCNQVHTAGVAEVDVDASPSMALYSFIFQSVFLPDGALPM